MKCTCSKKNRAEGHKVTCHRSKSYLGDAHRYIILDWAGNRIAPNLDFATFEDGWDHTFSSLSGELELSDEDYQEYYVVLKGETKV